MKNHHEELRWQKDDEIEMKDERIRWALRWFRWRFRRNGWGNLNSGKEKMKTLGTRIYSSRTNSEGRDYSLGWNKNKIYCMLILHQLRLMTRWIFHTTYSSWKKIEKWHIANWRKSSWITGRIEKNEWINMINKEKNLERTTVRIRKWLMEENESPGRSRRTNMPEGI